MLYSGVASRTPEALLRYQNALLSAQQESSIDGILTVDAAGRIVSYNRRFAELWELPPHVLSSRSDNDAVNAILPRILDPQRFLEDVADYYRHRWKRGLDEIALRDGRTFDRYTAPIFGPRGRYCGRVWFFRDVTAQRAEVERRIATEARYRELFEADSDPALVVDARTRRIEDANRAAVRHLGYAKSELIGLKAECLDPSPGEARTALRLWVSTGRWPRSIRRTLRRKDGTLFPAEINSGRFRQGAALKIVATLRDITDRERAAQAELLRERETLQRQFVATVSHELRTPIAAIRGFAETLMAGALDDAGSRRDFVETIFKHSMRVGQLVDDLLTLSLLESGRRQLRLEDVAARRFIADFVSGMEPVARRRRHRLTMDVCPDLVVRADSSQLTQVLQNLVDNALKFSPPGTKVTVEANSRGGLGYFRVRDSGPGIPSGQLGKVFEPFHRCEQTEKVHGAGLGLAIARQIVQAHGGRIWAESDGAHGTTVQFTLPAVLNGDRLSAVSSASRAAPASA